MLVLQDTLIVLVSAVGVFTVNNSVLDLFVMVTMGVLGYVLLLSRSPITRTFTSTNANSVRCSIVVAVSSSPPSESTVNISLQSPGR